MWRTTATHSQQLNIFYVKHYYLCEGNENHAKPNLFYMIMFACTLLYLFLVNTDSVHTLE